jgi:phosphoserine phosphatase RsbU/P
MTELRIGVLIDNIDSDYQVAILDGIVRGTRTLRGQTLLIAGGWLQTATAANHRNFVYELLPAAELSGLVVMAGSLSQACGSGNFRSWLSSLGSVPTVCVSLDVPGYPGVVVDNAVGMHAIISHLIEVHGHQRIAFICGPDSSDEAAARFEAYRRALKDHGIAEDPALWCKNCGWNREDGFRAVRELLERGHGSASLHAIACVNDDVALGVLEALSQLGLPVPDEIALVGFDDVPNARSANPPLTTASQSVEHQGYSAARSLVEALTNQRPPESIRIESTPVLRASCGCQIPFQNDSAALRNPSLGLARTVGLALRRDLLKSAMARAAAGRLGNQPGWENALFNALSDSIVGHSPVFVYALEQIGRRAIFLGAGTMPVHDVLTAIRLELLQLIPLQPELHARLEDQFQEGRLALTKVALAAYRERDQAKTQHVRAIAKACLDALNRRTFDDVAAALSLHLPPLGIQGCAVSRFVAQGNGTRELEVVFRTSSALRARTSASMAVAKLGVDEVLAHQSTLVIMPLDSNAVSLGLAVFTWGAHDPLLYEQLREWLSAALAALAPPPH